MSFGFSISDFKEVITLSWKLYEVLKDGPEDIKNIARDLTTVYGVLNHIQEDLQSNDSAIKAHGEGRMKMLQSMTVNLKATLDQVQLLVDKFRPMANGAKGMEQLWIKVKWVGGQRKIKRLHQDIAFHISSFNLLMTSMGNSSLQRIETGLEEMRLISEESSNKEMSEQKEEAVTLTGKKSGGDRGVEHPFPEHSSTEMSSSQVATIPAIKMAPRMVKVLQRSPEWLEPVVWMRSSAFRRQLEQSPQHGHAKLARIVFSNCRLACYSFFANNGLWRTKYGRDDSLQARKLFELNDGTFPSSPDDLELQEWLQKIRRACSEKSISDDNGVQHTDIWDYQGWLQHSEDVLKIPSLMLPMGMIDPDCFEECLVSSIHLCQHLNNWDAAGRLKHLWKRVQSSEPWYDAENVPATATTPPT